MRYAWLSVVLVGAACATGGTGDGGDVGYGGDGAGTTSSSSSSSGSGGHTTSASGTGGAPCNLPMMLCGGVCLDVSSNFDNCGDCGITCLLGQVCSGGDCVPESSSSSSSSSSASSSSASSSSASSSSASSSSASSSSASSSSASSSSSSGGTCNPLNPNAVCGGGNHCLPQPNGIPVCSGPTGPGGQYSSCISSADCANIYECVNTGFGTVYCMQWCTSWLDCSIFDDCYYLNPPVYVGGTEWGVCYDGLP